MAIAILEKEYKVGLESCKNNLHGKLLLSKGETPPIISYLQVKLNNLWKPLGSWHIVPIGKGYFDFPFVSVEYLHRVLVVGLWNLDLGTLRLFNCAHDFNPNLVK